MIETMSRTQLLRETLRLVNRARKALGEKPIRSVPAGDMQSPTSCPLARALGAEVVGEAWFRDQQTAEKVAKAWGTKVLEPWDQVGLEKNATGYPISCPVGYPVILPQVLVKFDAWFDRGLFQHLVWVNVAKQVGAARQAVGWDPFMPFYSWEAWWTLEGFLKYLPGHVDAVGRYLILSGEQAEKVAKAWNKRAVYHVDEYYRVRLPEPLGRHIRFLMKHR